MELTQRDLADAIDVPYQRVNELVNARRAKRYGHRGRAAEAQTRWAYHQHGIDMSAERSRLVSPSGHFRFARLAAVLLLLSACAAGTQEAAAERSWDDAPRLINPEEARRSIAAEYPADFRRRGIGGEVTLWLFVSENGRVIRTSVLESSGHEALDLAAIAVAEQMKFDPATKDGKPKGLWVRQAITFAVD